MPNITEKALKCLEDGKILEDELTRLELAKFLRQNPRPKIDTNFLPYVEIEAWTAYDRITMSQLMKSVGCSINPNSSGGSSGDPYPYPYWYLHHDGSIRVDEEKLKKLATEGKFPYTINTKSINNLNYRGDAAVNYTLSPEDMEKVPEDIKNSLAETKEYLKVLTSNIKRITKSPTLDEEISLTLSTAAYKIEFSTPALYDFKELRKAFFLFKVKANDGNPCMFVNPSCGLHINFKLPTLNIANKRQYLTRLLTLFVYLEPGFTHIVPRHRIDNDYCKFFTSRYTSINDVINYMFNHYDVKYNALYPTKSNANFQEFRFVNATSDIYQLENWILALQCLCQYAYDFDKPIESDIHIFDVITHPVLQNWYLKRQKHLKTKAVVDKVVTASDLEPISKLKIKRNELLKRKREEELNAEKARTMNSGSNSRKPISSSSRRTNAQAARYRIRSRRY